MAERSMTAGEIALASSIYGDLIDYSKVKIFDSKWRFFMPGDRAHSPNGNIYFPADYYSDFSSAPLLNKSTFIHELSHVWQVQRGVNVIVQAAINRNYDYKAIFSGTDFFALGVEAQAQFISDYYLLLEGVTFNVPRPDISVYESVMPDDIKEAPEHTIDILSPGSRCFAAGTAITMGDGSFKPIEQIQIGDMVSAFEGMAELTPRRVVRLFRNHTDEWLQLNFESGKASLLVTPTHEFLKSDGTFQRLDELIDASGFVSVVTTDGSVELANAQKLRRYAEDGEHAPSDVGSKNYTEQVFWETFNFEVEDLHTYVAGGVRVHNTSVLDFIPSDASIEDIGFDEFFKARTAVYVRADGIRVQIVGADVDGDGNTEKLQETLLIPASSSGAGNAVVTQVRTFDPFTGVETGRHVDSIVYKESSVQLGRVGQVFGSALGNALAGGNDLKQIAAGTLLATLAQNVGQFLQNSAFLTSSLTQVDGVDLTTTPITDAADAAFSDLGQDLVGNLRLQVINSLSSMIMAELLSAIGLDGTDAEIISVVGTSVTSQLLANISANALDASSNVDLFNGFNTVDLPASIATALGGYFGSKLGDSIVDPETKEAAIAGAVASAMGGYIGATLLSAIPIIGTFIGSFLGKILGNFFGNLFSSDTRESAYVLTLNPATGDIVIGHKVRHDDADMSLSNSMANNVVSQVNAIMDAADAHFDTDGGRQFRESTIGWKIKSKKQVFYTKNEKPTAWNSLYDGMSWDKNIGKKPSSGATEAAATATMKETISELLLSNDIVSSDVYKERAFYSSRDKELAQLGMDLKIAEDYRRYTKDQTVINALIAAEPYSEFAAGWIATLARAQEINLNKAGRSDFSAGFRGLIELFQLDSFGATLGDLSVNAQNGGLVIDIALRPTSVVPQRVFDLYGGQAGIISVNGERVLRFVIDSATLNRGEYRGVSMEYAANSEGAAADQATAGGSIWEVRGQQYLKTLWVGADRQNDYRDSDTYWNFANNDPAAPGSDDILIGGSQRDNINGSSGRDWIQGGAGDDALYGDAGDDVLIGGAGNDYLTGGSGQDRFVFRDGFGYDAIADFEVNGGDKIEFGTKDMRSFQEVMSLTKNTSEGAIIIRNPESSILLKGVTKESLRADNFSLRPAPLISVADVKVMEGSAVIGTGDGFLHTEGNQIVDAAGNPFKIAGVNWFGLESKDLVPHGLYDRDWRSMMDQMKSLGFNTIRLPFASQTLHPDSRPMGGETGGVNLFMNQDLLVSGAYDYHFPIADQQAISSLEIMDKIIDYAGKIGLRIILDHHRSNVGISASENGLWYNDQYSDANWVSDWAMLAERYAGNATIIGADLHNEPHGKTAEGGATWGDGSATDWRAAAERAGNAIGAVNKDWLIFVEGIEEYNGEKYWWGGNLMGAKDNPVRLNLADKLVYSAHDYPNSVFAQPWFSDPSFPANLPDKFRQMWGYLYENNTAPVWLGEIGTSMTDPKDLAWLEKMQAYLKGDLNADGTRDVEAGKQGVSWTWWSWNPDSGDTGGILNDDWKTVDQNKLSHLQPVMSPTTTTTRGKTLVSFTISLSYVATEAVTLNYQTVANGKAVAGGDFEAISGSLTFLPGEQTKIVTTTIYRDNLDEGDETFSLLLSNASNGVLGKATAIATIANDDHSQFFGTATVTDDWGSGFIGQIRVKNTAATAVNDGWTYQFDMPYEISEIWDAEIVMHTGTTYVVRNVSTNGIVAAGEERSFGFKASPGGADATLIRVDKSIYQAFGTAGVDVITGRDQANGLHGGAGNDVITGRNFADLLDGEAGDDKLYGSGGSDRLYGGDGNDLLDGGSGADLLFGGAGFDTASYQYSAQGVTVSLSAVAGVGGEAQGDQLMSIESLIGSAFVDVLTGDAGDNRFQGMAGNDTIDGGSGNDTADYSEKTTSVSVTLSGAIDARVAIGGVLEDTIRNIENVIGGSGDDFIVGDGLANILVGAGGIDVLDGAGGIDTVDYSGRSAAVVVTLTGSADATVWIGGNAEDTVRNIENVVGGSGADKLVGDGGANSLYGGAGDDQLYGNGGNDRLDGGAGDDQIYGGDQGDTIDAGIGNDTVYAGGGDDNVAGGEGVDLLDGGGGNDILLGGSGDDKLFGFSGNDTLDGGDGNDELYGSAGNDVLSGGTGNDKLYGNGGLDHFIAGAGDDQVYGGDAADIIDGGSGNDVIYANGGDDQIVGGDGNDLLDGGAGNDLLQGGEGDDTYIVDAAGDIVQEAFEQGNDKIVTTLSSYTLGANVENLIFQGGADFTGIGNELANILIGGSGNDTLKGGGGSDTIDGGNGIDTADYSDKTTAIMVTLNGATGVNVTVGGIAEDIIQNIENLVGGSAEDLLAGDQFANVLVGNAGDDKLYGRGGGDTLRGGDGNDELYGELANDVLEGGNGNDKLFGNGGSDVFDGGEGNDELYGGTASDVMNGGAGDDILYGNGGADHLNGGAGDDKVFGGAQADVIDAGTGDDIVFGNGGDDQISGGDGADVLDGGAGSDSMDGGAGLDTADYSTRTASVVATLRGSTATSVTIGGVSEDTIVNIENIIGGSADDTLRGDDYATILKGNAGNDQLDGSGGDDTLYGGMGNDILTGGTGADIFVFDTTLNAVSNVEVITDFSIASDRFWLEHSVFNVLPPGALQAADFGIGSAATNTAQNIIYEQSSGKLFYDSDGSGATIQVQFASVSPNLSLSAANFQVI